MWNALRLDVRHSFRSLRRAPTFSLIVIVTLALAVGATTAVGSLLNAFVLRTLAVPSPEQLVALSALRNVKLGIIGFDARYVISPRHGFWIFDEDLVSVETHSAGLHLAQPQEIELYGRVFDQLAAVASYGSEARAIILRVIDDLAGRSPEDGL